MKWVSSFIWVVKCGVAIIIFIRGLKDWVASYLFIRFVVCEVAGSLFMQRWC